MHGQIGFRHALAVAQLLFFLAVSGYSQFSRYEMRGVPASARDPFGLNGGGAHEWVQVCAIVNAPAVMALGWIGRIVPAFLSWIAILIVGAGVFAQWYVVGLWRDESVGLARSRSLAGDGWILRVFLWLGFAAAGLVGLTAVGVQIFLFESSNAILISLAIWCGFFAIFFLARIRGTSGDGSTLKI